MCRIQSGGNSCNCPSHYCVRMQADQEVFLNTQQGFAGGNLKKPVDQEVSNEIQLAKLIASFNKLDARGRATLLRMAECMPSGQVAG